MVNTTITEQAPVSQHMLGLCPGCLLPHSVNTMALVLVADIHFHGWCLLSHIKDWKHVAGRPPQHTVGSTTTSWQEYQREYRSRGQSMMSAEKRGERAEHRLSLEVLPEPGCSLTLLSDLPLLKSSWSELCWKGKADMLSQQQPLSSFFLLVCLKHHQC